MYINWTTVLYNQPQLLKYSCSAVNHCFHKSTLNDPLVQFTFLMQLLLAVLSQSDPLFSYSCAVCVQVAEKENISPSFPQKSSHSQSVVIYDTDCSPTLIFTRVPTEHPQLYISLFRKN